MASNKRVIAKRRDSLSAKTGDTVSVEETRSGMTIVTKKVGERSFGKMTDRKGNKKDVTVGKFKSEVVHDKGRSSDTGFFGHYSVPNVNMVPNAPLKNTRKQDSFTAKPFVAMNVGSVGKGAPIDTGDRR